ncbi:hypothetical protein ACJX0J_031006, partial [Zea mays]
TLFILLNFISLLIACSVAVETSDARARRLFSSFFAGHSKAMIINHISLALVHYSLICNTRGLCFLNQFIDIQDYIIMDMLHILFIVAWHANLDNLLNAYVELYDSATDEIKGTIFS